MTYTRPLVYSLLSVPEKISYTGLTKNEAAGLALMVRFNQLNGQLQSESANGCKEEGFLQARFFRRREFIGLDLCAQLGILSS